MENETRLNKKEFETLLQGFVSKAVEEKATALGLDKIDRKFGNFPGSMIGMTDAEVEGMSKTEKMTRFIKAVFNKDTGSLAVMKAMTEGTGSAGGFLVPEEFATDVYRIVEDFGLMAKMATPFQMGSDTLLVPRISASVSVTYPGEATAGTESQPTLEQVTLALKDCVGLTAVSNPLLADANIDTVKLLQNLFAEAIAGAQDSQGFVGTGSPFTGITGDTGVTVVTAASGDDTFTEAATPAYARQLIAQLKPSALVGAAFFMHRSVWSIMQLKRTGDTTGDYFGGSYNPVITVNAVMAPGQPAGTLWEYPVYLTDKLPTTTAVSTKFIVFGNLKNMFIGRGTGGQLAMAISQDATLTTAGNLFEKNMSAIRVIDRHAISVGLPAAFAVLKTAAS